MKKLEGETSYTDQPICPYCRHEHRDGWEMEGGENYCDVCEKTFFLEILITVQYTTIRLEHETK